jgi:hypothetical protein
LDDAESGQGSGQDNDSGNMPSGHPSSTGRGPVEDM